MATTADILFDSEGVHDYYDPSGEAVGMVGRIIVGDPAAYPAQDPSELPEAVQENLPTVEQILAEPDGVLTWEEFQAQKE